MATRVFRDFDAFAGSVQDVDARMTLCNMSQRSWSISRLALPGIDVQLGRLGSGNIVEGESWSDGYLFYRPLTAACAYKANGTLIGDNEFMVLEPGCDFSLATQEEHDWCSVFVPTQLIAPGERSNVRSPASEGMVCRVMSSNRQIIDRFRAIIEQVIDLGARSPQFASSPAASCAASELLDTARSVLQHREADRRIKTGRPSLPRREIIRRSLRFLEARTAGLVQVKEIASAAEVSERTLRAAFTEYFGVAPVRYLQLRQLNQVQRALRMAEPHTTTVGGVLVEHGVWEFSRFALRYRQLFGECPSETLRRG